MSESTSFSWSSLQLTLILGNRRGGRLPFGGGWEGMASLPQKKRGLEAKPDIFKALTSLNLKLGGVQVPNQPLEMHLL